MKRTFIKIFYLIVLSGIGLFGYKSFSNLDNREITSYSVESITLNSNNEYKSSDYIYLSDLSPSTNIISYGSLGIDKTPTGPITLRLNGSNVEFDKGLYAHAESTLIYDLHDYQDFAYFTTYYGVNISANNRGDGVKFYIYTSVDGNDWVLKTDKNPKILKSSNEAEYVKIDIKDANYIKLVANKNINNGNDHSAWADAKIVKESYKENNLKTVEEYDQEIKDYYQGTIDNHLELLLLQRDLVKKIGNYQLNKIYKNYKEAFDFIFNDLDNLKLYVLGGTPDGTYVKSFAVLTDLLNNYKVDLNDTRVTNNQVKYSEVFKKMMVSLSLTHSQSVSFWIRPGDSESSVNPNVSNAIVRYDIFKDMFVKGLLEDNVFETLEVEEMRYIMNSFINDDELLWLNNYAKTKKNHYSGYSYMEYKNVNTALYRGDNFFGENRKNYIDKYKLAGYNVADIKHYPKLWMIMEIGGVCWQISNVGQNVVTSLGLPSTLVGQPGHSAYLVYTLDANGNGIWDIWNDVGGWKLTNKSAYSGHKSYFPIRYINGWGNESFASTNSGTYMLLGQAAMNDYSNYILANNYILLANTYKNDNVIKEQLYRNALKLENFNLDAWYNLIKIYNDTKTDEEKYALAEELTNALKYYPLPMSDLIKQININNVALNAKMTALLNDSLVMASKATADDSIQAKAVVEMAKYLLGTLDMKVAEFSFDNNTLSLASRYDATNVAWQYSFDGGNTWTNTELHNVVLTEEEISRINSTNDIKVHIFGVDYSPENIFTIDIIESTGIPNNLYGNDLENKVIGDISSLEWRYSDSNTWTNYNTLPDLTGDKKLLVRKKANGLYLPSTEREFNFTKDSEDETKKYISIDHLSVVDFSSENVRPGENEHAKNAIDGNIYTKWHTNRTATNDERYIIIKLDKPRYISKMEYLKETNYKYGVLKSGIISTSLNGKDFTDIYNITNIPNTDGVKEFVFGSSVYAQYIKLKVTESYDYLQKENADYFISAAMINVFEDATKNIPTAEVEYSRDSSTARVVEAKLVNPSEDIIITNNNSSDTYTFTENGEFIFEFEDKNGNKGSARAYVDWIVDNSFAFDGEDPYTIILSNKYNGKNWQYSIDGGNTWISKNGLFYTLSEDEINSLDANLDLKVKVDGIEEEITYDILPAEDIPDNLYGNDWENKVIGVSDDMEWRIDGKWTSFAEKNPDLTGNKTIEVRRKAFGTTLHSESRIFTFTEDRNDATKVYIPIEHIKVVDFSSENIRANRNEYEYANNAIDGNINTMWHTDRTAKNDARFIVLKLDKPMYLSELEYIQKPSYSYGLMKKGRVYVSVDGENWTFVSEEEFDNVQIKKFSFENEVYASFVKIETISSYDYLQKPGVDYFATVAMINLYQDKTIKHSLSIKVLYDIDTITNKDVIAKIISTNEEIKILNNNGSNTYKFSENGEFTFEFIDEENIMGSFTAKVDWIDKTAPSGEITYDERDYTNGPVVATLNTKEEVTILNNDGKDTYTFTENGEFTFEYMDKAGNVNKSTAKVDWIKVPTKVEIHYSNDHHTGGEVIATIIGNNDIKVTNNDGSMSYTFTDNDSFEFEYMDKYGDTGKIIAKVTWINKTLPVADVSYSIKTLTNKDVIVTLINPNKNLTILNNDGKDTYTFTENGEFIFDYKDDLGNVGSTVAIVNWIDKEIPTGEITYDVTDYTSGPVVATLNTKEEVTILNNEKSNTYTFEENGEFTFEYMDKAGNVNKTTAKVDWIKVPTKVEIKYSNNHLTNENVVATIVGNNDMTVTNNDGSTSYTFIDNDSFEFEYVDKYGETGKITAEVTWIDKEVPTGDIIFNITQDTKENVIVTLIPSEDITVLNNDGNISYTFEENGEFTFEYMDKAGNINKTTASVNWIHKDVQDVDITYSTKMLTKEDVIVTLILKEGMKILNNNGNNTYIFTENGTFTFEYIDKYGNIGKKEVVVDWIDKTLPEVEIIYSTKKITNNPVIVTLRFNEDVTILNNNGSTSYTFLENGTYTFEYKDKAGNIGSTVVTVDWIKKNTNNSNNNDKPIKVETVTEQILEVEGIKVKLEYKDKLILKKNTFDIDKKFVNKVGKDSIGLELDLVDENGNSVDVSNNEVTILFNIDSTNEFKGIYFVEGNKLKQLKFTYENDNTIRITTNGVGKFILSYNEESTKKELDLVMKQKNLPIAYVLGAIVVVGSAIIVLYKKNNK